MSRLFAAQCCATFQHLFKDILVTDVRPHHLNAGVAQRNLQPHVRHSCRHDSRPFEHSARLHISSGKQKHAISVHNPPGRIAEQRAIRIAIEGYAKIKLPPLRQRASYHLRMQRTAIFVDVPAVRSGIEERCLNPASAEQLRRFRRSGSISTVHQDSQPAQVSVNIRRQPFDVCPSQRRFTRQAGRESASSLGMFLRIFQ